jgi:hypothetical protein
MPKRTQAEANAAVPPNVNVKLARAVVEIVRRGQPMTPRRLHDTVKAELRKTGEMVAGLIAHASVADWIMCDGTHWWLTHRSDAVVPKKVPASKEREYVAPAWPEPILPDVAPIGANGGGTPVFDVKPRTLKQASAQITELQEWIAETEQHLLEAKTAVLNIAKYLAKPKL